MLLPALTFLVGLALGGALVGVTSGSDEVDGDANGPTVTSAPTPEPAGPLPSPTGLLVRVPDPCLQAVDKAEVAYGVLDQAVAAARELDARRLQELVDQVQQERRQTEALVEACRVGVGAPQPSPTVSR